MARSAKAILAEAIESEKDIATRAKGIRNGSADLTRELFLELWPLLREPIPEGFLSTVPKQTGKPYDSTGITSVQVQITRMDNVLTPLWWWDKVEYHDEGCLARVRVGVNGYGEKPLYAREAWGGVDRGSTKGNIYKGSYTNAAKPAFARIGPGWEVYVGATDLDPDVSAQAAKAAAKASRSSEPSGPRLLTDDEREKVLVTIEQAGGGADRVALLLGAVGVEDAAELTTAHAFELRKLLDEGKS